jgi:hypothetical protein
MLLNIPFSYLFFVFLQVFTHTKKKLVMTCKFECFQSHICHILKELYEFFVYDECLNHFWRRCIYIYMGKLWIGDKVIWGCMYNFKNKKLQFIKLKFIKDLSEMI